MDHPQAQDTLEGITEWWLLDQYVRQRSVEVRESLAGLAEEELLLVRERLGTSPSYQLNPERMQEIRALVAASADTVEGETG